MIETNIWTAKSEKDFTQPGEHILCAFILGPDQDDPTGKRLHIRANQDAIDALKHFPLEKRLQLVQGATLLLEELIRRVLS